MNCHEVDYRIVGHDIQMVEIELIRTKLWSPKPAR